MMKKISIALLCIFLMAVGATGQTALRDSNIVLQTKTGNIKGSIVMPAAFSNGELVILISGSGPTDRDGNNPMMKNNSLKQLAYALADSGFAVLRYDKRGVAASSDAMKSESELRFDDYVEDARAWISKMRTDNRFKKITIAGHSEGALIGMLASAANVDRFISIAGAGRSAGILLKDQLAAQPAMVKEPSYRILDSLQAGVTVSDVPQMLYSLFRPSVQPYMISWIKHDPKTIFAGLSIPVMICQGTKDLQVSTIDAHILAESNKKSTLHIEENMNHVLKNIKGDMAENQKSYADPELPVAAGLVRSIVYFLRNQ